MTGPDMVNYSDGNFTNNTDFTKINPQLNPPLTTSRHRAALRRPSTTRSSISRACRKGQTLC